MGGGEAAGAGPPGFLCLHGLVDRLEIWDRIAGPLSERGRLACIDQRGHGESQASVGPCRREDLAADVRAVMRALDVPSHVLASSILAEHFPDAELVVVPDCGHWVQVEKPQALLEAIDGFLPRLAAAISQTQGDPRD